MSIAFVLSGGGSLGAVQVGMLEALASNGVRPELLVGTSVGALNAAWVATHPWPDGTEGLERLWRGLRRDDVFPTNPISGLLGFIGSRNYVISARNLERLMLHHLPVTRIEDAAIPLYVVATEVLTGLEVLLAKGPLVPALLASSALPGIFPTIRIGERDLMDGGVADNTPLSHAVALGADVLYVLPTGYACDLPTPPRNPLGMLLHTIALFVEQQLIRDVARYENKVELHLLPPLCPLTVSPVDFSHTAELIERARAATDEWLSQKTPIIGQTRFLGLHRHA